MNSSNKHRAVLNTSFWALLQMVFLQVGTLVTTMYITRMLSIAEYGLIPLINSLVVLLVVFVGLGLPGSLARFLAAQDTKYQQKDLVVKALIGGLPWMSVAIVCVFISFPLIVELLNAPNLLELQWVFIFILMLELFRLFIEKICHGTGTMRISATFSGWASLSIVIVTVPALLHTSTAIMALSAKAIALLIPSIRATLSLKRALTETNLKSSNELVSSNKLPNSGEMIKYGFPLAVISLSGFGFVQLDMLFLAYYVDTTTVGLYSVGVLILVKLTALSKSIGFGISPFYARGDNEGEQDNYYLIGLKYVLIVAIPLAIYLAIEGASVMAFLFGGHYSKSGDSLTILCFYFIMSSILAVTSPVLDFGGKAKARAYGAIAGALVNLILNIILIPHYGAVGAAIATVCGYSVLFGVTVKTASKIVSVNVWKNSSIFKLTVFIGPGLLMLMLFVKYYSENISLWVNGILLVLAYPFSLYIFDVIKKSEYVLVRNALLKK